MLLQAWRPPEVIDQDAVFAFGETYDEVIRTRVFEDFYREQDIRPWVCNKADPESKGSIENSIGFMKKKFVSARKVTCIDDVWRSLPIWLDGKSGTAAPFSISIRNIPESFHTVSAMTDNEKTTALIPSVGADGGQPPHNSTKQRIPHETCESNPSEENIEEMRERISPQ